MATIKVKRKINTDTASSLSHGELGATQTKLFYGNQAGTAVAVAIDSSVLHLAGNETITGVKTFNAIPVFNGGSSASTAPFTVDSSYKVTNLNADKLDGADLETSLSSTSDIKVPTSQAVASYISSLGYTSDQGTVTGVTAGTGLSGGGTSGAVSLALDFSELTDMTGDISGSTEFILQNGTTESRKAANEIKLSNFDNDSGWTSNSGTVTQITAGNGLDFTTISSSGAITLGTPGTLTNTSTDSVTSTSHTHKITNYAITGTTNQIAVTGGGRVLGAATTLSLPQDIHTGATPQFTRLGLGVAASSTIPLYIKSVTPEIKLEAGTSTDSATIRYDNISKSIKFIFA